MSTLSPAFISGARDSEVVAQPTSDWLICAYICWRRRRFLLWALATALLLSVLIAFTLPKTYKSSASIMPPPNASAGPAVLAALAGRSLGGLTGLSAAAGSLLSSYNASSVVVELLHSGTIADHLITRYNLQHVYRKRFRSDAAKALARHTKIIEEKKSGAVSITVEDRDPHRARDLAQGYLDELNQLVIHTSTSSAHQERAFIEQRLALVHSQLEQAQQRLSEFSSTHATVDIKEQTRALIDATSRLQAERVVEQSDLNSLRLIYGPENVRLRSAEARLSVLDAQLGKISGTADSISSQSEQSKAASEQRAVYPPLRQLPRLAVPYADLYRDVQINETVFELLTREYELARIQEAKDIPVINVIDCPGVPDKKSFPPRILLCAALTILFWCSAFAYVLLEHRWSQLSTSDPRRLFAADVMRCVRLGGVFR